VGGRVVRGSPRHEELNRQSDVIRDGRNNLQVEDAKLNTKSLTEAELVGASEYLANTIWMHMFMEKQG
jgi:hypothetical protein